MDFSKLKLEVYDIMAVIFPGLLATSEGWVLLKGWTSFIISLNQLSGTSLLLLVVFAFGSGHLVQEFSDITVKSLKGGRYFRRARDRFWVSDEAGPVKVAMKTSLGTEIASVDSTYDYCLTKLKDRFVKRDLFVAISDLCRSMAVLSLLAVVPAARIAWQDVDPSRNHAAVFLVLTALLLLLAVLSWRRMTRFRELSEVTVFRAYLAVADERSEK